MTTGLVFDLRRYAIHDGPGIRTTVFLKGCPLRCAWCHNPEGQAGASQMVYREARCIRCGACVAACTEGAIAWDDGSPQIDPLKCTRCGACVRVCFAEAREALGQEMTVEQVLAQVERDLPFYDQSGGGVTFSGGEPLLQHEFLLALLRASHSRGIATALDTCGYASWEALDEVRRHVDHFLFDLKLIDDTAHCEFTGVSNELILRNLRALSEQGHAIRLRVPVVPGINDSDRAMGAVGAFAASLPRLEGVDLLPYHEIGAHKYERLGRPYGLASTRPPSSARMEEIARLLLTHGLSVATGG